MLCWECLTVADDLARGWRAYRGDVPGRDPEPILIFYCPDCAEPQVGPFTARREVTQLVRTLWTAAGSALEPAAEIEHRRASVGRYLRRRLRR